MESSNRATLIKSQEESNGESNVEIKYIKLKD